MVQSNNGQQGRRRAAKTPRNAAMIRALVAQLGSSEGATRQKARAELVAAGEAAVPLLVIALGSSDAHERWEAASALEEIASPAAALALVRALDDDHGGIRWLAQRALIRIGPASLEHVLDGLVHGAGSPWMREGAAHVLTHVRADDHWNATTRPVLDALKHAEPAVTVPPRAAMARDQLRQRRLAPSKLRATKARPYYFARTIQGDIDTAVAAVKRELAKEGFGVLTEIDVQHTLRQKLGADFRPYRILGACNPPLAHQALLAEDKIGAMLPCNVIVQEATDGQTEVAAVDPVASLQVIDNPVLREIAGQAGEKLRRMIAAL